MPSDPIKWFLFLFYLQITSGTETRKEKSSQTHKGRKREKKNDSQTQQPNLRRNGEIMPLSSCRWSLSFSISLSLLNRVWSSQHRTDRDLAFAPITISPSRQLRSRLHANCNRSTAPRDLASRQTQSPLSLPSSLNLTGFDDIFFWVLFVFMY